MQIIETTNINGDAVLVREHQTTINTSSFEGSGSRPGRIRYTLINGNAVNRQKDGTFVVVQSGDVLTPR